MRSDGSPAGPPRCPRCPRCPLPTLESEHFTKQIKRPFHTVQRHWRNQTDLGRNMSDLRLFTSLTDATSPPCLNPSDAFSYTHFCFRAMTEFIVKTTRKGWGFKNIFEVPRLISLEKFLFLFFLVKRPKHVRPPTP